MGPNSSSSLSLTPRAARLAQPVNVFVVCVVDSFMMVLLSQVSYSSIGMLHHLLFGKSFSFGSILPLLWTKFRYLNFDVNEQDMRKIHEVHSELIDLVQSLGG